MHKRYDGRLYCFSPPVMIATFAVESAMAAYTLWRYRLDQAARLAVALLVFLALFQLSEYFVCGGWGVRAADWSRTGYVAITLLPPLGLHLLHVLAARKRRRLVGAAYASAVLFIGYFLLCRTAFRGYACTGNYVIFQLGYGPALLYGAYYYGWLFAALGLGWRWLQTLRGRSQATARRRETVRALMIGYLVFLVPTAVANSVSPATRRGIPSVMCGFAVLFAFILTFYILPRVGRQRQTAR